MSSLRLPQDLRYALRSLGKSRGFAAVTVLTLAITLGANATIFALIDAVLLKPLPFAQPDRLVALWNASPEDGEFKKRVRAMDFLHWRERSEAFDRLALFSYDSKTLTGAGDPTQVFGSRVTEDFFPLLGVTAFQGRVFDAQDYAPDAPDTVVISHALWRQLGAASGIVGSTITLDEQAVTVIGVLRRQIMPLVAWHLGRLELGSSQAHYWLRSDAEALYPRSGVHGVLGRLAGGVSAQQAAGRMEVLARELEAEFPATHEGFRVTLVRLLDEAVGDVSTSLWLLLGAVGLTLLIACANVANLFLVRADQRRKEFALRSALGASRLRIWRQVTLEGALLALAGALLGTLLAFWALRLLPRVSPEKVPRLDEIALDPRVLGATLGLCLLCGLLCTLVPAFQAGRLDLDSVLRAGGRRGSGTGSPRLRQLLVVTEMALAVVLVVGSGLLLRSFSRLSAVDPGFERGHVLTFKLLPHASAYPEMHQLTGFYDRAFAELRSVPGVTSVAAAYDHPLDSNWTQSFRLEAGSGGDGNVPPEGGQRNNSQGGAFRTVTADYFATMGVEILAGRGFTEGDDAGAPGAVIVNETFVRRHFPDREPLGQRLEAITTHWQWGDDAIPSSFRVVGVVEDVRFKGLAAPPEAAFYIPYRQTPHFAMTTLVRAERELGAQEIRDRLRAIDPRVPIARVETLDALLSSEVAKPRFSALALSGFAAGALLLAVLGMWGVLSYAVRQRVHEIGIRLALGAAGREVFRWAIWHGLRPAFAGVAAGVLAAAALSRLLRGVLFEISPTDPATFVAVPVLLLAAAFLACALPALRAARTDPMAVLREE